ncbi:universal stress protein [Streptomyces sp. NPDC094472]|uniref:universal stress protein n=1 Tax=unclassified Streptomyces TaxID=2593676 RepID=UPI003328365C
MELPLVVGVDGSDSSLQAVDWAVDEAARHGLPLRLVHASRWERYEETLPSFGTERPSVEVLAEHVVASCAERARLRKPDVKVSGEVTPDDAVDALLEESRQAFAVVTGNRGRSELPAILLGSVGLAVAARAVCPVIVVRGAERNRNGELGEVILGVGDLTEDSTAVQFALREAQVREAELDAVRAWRRPAHEPVNQPPFMREAGALLREEQAAAIISDVLGRMERDPDKTPLRRDVVEGPAHKVLLAASERADLLVVGALRPHGHLGLQLGRVSHAVLHHSACPVAVVPQQV